MGSPLCGFIQRPAFRIIGTGPARFGPDAPARSPFRTTSCRSRSMFGFPSSPRPRQRPLPSEVRLDLGDREVAVAVRRSERAVRYSLRLSADGEPVLTLPGRGGSFAEAVSFLERHRGWLDDRLSRRPAKVPFAPGAILPLRGRPHLVEHHAERRGTVWLDGSAEATPPTPDQDLLPKICVAGGVEHVSRRVADFLKREARADLTRAVEIHTRRLGVKAAAIRLKDTKTRWGSCTAEGELSFSWRVVLAPPHVLDYLAAHEVAHLREMNHSHRFWAHVAATCPAWREGRHWLKTQGVALHAYG